MNLNAILDIAVSEMKYKSSHPLKELGNKFYHGQRVCETIKHLCEMIGYKEDINVLIVAAWFHDICNGSENHEILGANKVKELLEGLCTNDELSSICRLITLHDSRTNSDLSIDTKILQDADLLDHFGVFEIWCTFHYALKENLSMEETAEFMLNNYNTQFQKEKSQLHFECSKRIYVEKRLYVRDFITRMQEESKGNFMPTEEVQPVRDYPESLQIPDL
jgi:Predicted HD superfamily hydrolase